MIIYLIRLWFWGLLIMILSLAFPLPVMSSLLSSAQCKCVQNRIELELKLNPAYLMHHKLSQDPGAPGDCSGKLHAILRSCGVHVTRVTSKDMAHGADGWGRFPIVEYIEGKPLSLIFFTLPPQKGKKARPLGHVGVLLDTVQYHSVTRMAHASTTFGFISVSLKKSDFFYKHMELLRQIK